MTYPQTSPPPSPSPYPATSSGRRRLHIECQSIGISRDMVEKCGKVEGLQEKEVNLDKVLELGVMNKNEDVFSKDSVVSINRKFIEHNNGRLSDQSLLELLALERFNQSNTIIPYEKLEGPEFPLVDLLVTDDVTYVGNEKNWPQPIDYDVQKELDKPESIFYNGEEKRWDDNVGQYPPQNSVKSNEEFLEYLKDLAERQRLLLKGLFLLKSYGVDFVGKAGEL